jgi:uncharacterized heparinase superfamily protein
VSPVARMRLYFDTLRHLKPVQIYGRLRFQAVRPRLDIRPCPPLRPTTGEWVAPARRRQSQMGPGRFSFLNEPRDIGAGGWDDEQLAKLWRYNLHYFDDLNAAGAEHRARWHEDLVSRWIAENRPGQGTGWEPYPTSLRIANWIKWALSGHALSAQARDSLAQQARWLARRLEYHLLGNHLLANAKALTFAGMYFEGAEAENWLATGSDILRRQLPEQVLPDGGHFELSPLYHTLALEDLLDLANAGQAFAGTLDPALNKAISQRIGPMRSWLAVMCHPDGEISFFNDAATGLAPSPTEVEAYAARLGLPPVAPPSSRATCLRDSGYIRLEDGPAVALLDVARIGPDYLPGHAHADTLSFELSLWGRRVLVNSGTSVYGTGPERLRQRGTAAHNTVTVDGQNSSEVWSGFRVARRARPQNLGVSEEHRIGVECAHDGYERLANRPIHRRAWSMDSRGLRVLDIVTSAGIPSQARFHFHPEVSVALDEESGKGSARISGAGALNMDILAGKGRLEPSTWHPEFGVTRSSRCLVISLHEGKSAVQFNWN